ncbi:solute carrier family 22 member 13-like [Neopelma chrysocephalum]|uniref:solute carrier family 22 member 13-like n=1 Tax=Neopelma chrysocephalum TaxID=114329 RepID=UPI000FCCF03E|nr:solute carrier family 22 member 13-like [Neopelma chrysocephalum]
MAEFGDVISALGEFGLYQKLLILLLALPLLLNPFQMVGQVFMVVDVPHHCDTSWILAVGPNLTQEEQLNLTLPRDADGEYEQCSMYSPVDWDLDSIVAHGLNATQKCSSGWVYPSAEPVLPESARWLVTKGRMEEAKKLLQKAAATNKRSLPAGLLEQLKPEKQTKPVSLLDLFRKKHLRKVTLIMSCIWFADSIVYYGLSLSVTGFGLDIYLTQLAFGAVEFPARVFLIFLLEWFGRKKMQAMFLMLSGLMCLILTGLPEDQPVAITVLAIIGKFTATAAFSTSYVYSAELFPTVVRQTGVGLCSTVARVAGILAPLIIPLNQYHRAIPMAIFGSIPVLVSLTCILLPETRGADLPDDTGKGQTPAENKKTEEFFKADIREDEADLEKDNSRSSEIEL